MLEPLVEDAPDFPEAHLSLATACHRLGDRAAATRHRKRAQELMVNQQQPSKARRYESAGIPEP